jgi:hypothetical protein
MATESPQGNTKLQNDSKKPNTLFRRLLKKLDDHIEIKRNHTTFTTLVEEYKSERNMSNSELYKNAHLDRRLFHKMMIDRFYHPDKNTVILLGLGLKLTRKEMDILLATAGYKLSYSLINDLIIIFCIENKIYNVTDVNSLLFVKEQKILSRNFKRK